MKISTNQFTKKTFNKVSGTWVDGLSVSSNQAVKKTFKKGTNSWEGPNTSETAYGVDDMFGGPDSTYGNTPYGGTAHFRLRTGYDVNH